MRKLILLAILFVLVSLAIFLKSGISSILTGDDYVCRQTKANKLLNDFYSQSSKVTSCDDIEKMYHIWKSAWELCPDIFSDHMDSIRQFYFDAASEHPDCNQIYSDLLIFPLWPATNIDQQTDIEELLWKTLNKNPDYNWMERYLLILYDYQLKDYKRAEIHLNKFIDAQLTEKTVDNATYQKRYEFCMKLCKSLKYYDKAEEFEVISYSELHEEQISNGAKINP